MNRITERKVTGLPAENQFVETETAASDSIELTRNAKGTYQWVIKWYTLDEDAEKVLDRLQRIDAELRRRFGETNGNS